MVSKRPTEDFVVGEFYYRGFDGFEESVTLVKCQRCASLIPRDDVITHWRALHPDYETTDVPPEVATFEDVRHSAQELRSLIAQSKLGPNVRAKMEAAWDEGFNACADDDPENPYRL